MGFWSRLFSRKADTVRTSLDLFREIYGGRESAAGVVVNVDRALRVATVLACCKVIAEGIAQVPWRVYREQSGKKSLATGHPLYNLLYRRPNRWQTSFELRETLAFHTVLCGNFYGFIARVGRAREVREIIPIEPARVRVTKLANDRLDYEIAGSNGASEHFPQEVIWHVRGPSWNGWLGMEGIKLAREAIGLSIATEEAHATFHRNGAKSYGTYAIDGPLSPEKYDFLAKWLDKYASGGERVGKPMILDMGAKWLQQQMTGVDAQHIETRKHEIEEICRTLRVMPIMVGHADKTATYASAEQMFLAHVVHTLMPWYQRLEQSGDINLLTEAEREEGYYTKFNPNALMRGAAADRGAFYAQGLGAGGHPAWLTPNDVRDLEEMERSDDANADKLFYPAASIAGKGPPDAKPPA